MFQHPPKMAILTCALVVWMLYGVGGEARQLAADTRIPTLYHRKTTESEYVVLADNPLVVPVYFYISATTLTNITPSVPLPHTVVVEPRAQEQALFIFRTADPTKRSNFRYNYLYGYGNPFRATHQDGYHYLFPYRHGTKHSIGQGYFGRHSHARPQDNYALDFNMPINTAIHAARAGVVAHVKEDSRRGGANQQYSQDANFIIIMHNDGSFGYYVHLVQNGALVQEGEYVEAGQHIGFSGNTGFSSGPHLHFDVRLPQMNGEMQTIPTTFVHYHNRIVEPQESHFYYAVHPGGVPFEPIIGRDLRASDYDGYLRSIPQSGGIDFRTERIDNSIIAFVSNGFPQAVTLEIRFTTSGVSSERGNLLELAVPAQAEIFCNIFHANSDSNQIRVSPRIRIIK